MAEVVESQRRISEELWEKRDVKVGFLKELDLEGNLRMIEKRETS